MTVRPLIAGALIFAAAVSNAEQRQLDAHEHGAGTLDLARAGNAIEVFLRAPGADIVGFEHAATSQADRQAVAEALDLLGRADTILALPDAAGCEAQEAAADLVTMGDDHDGETDETAEHDDHDAGASGHTEFHARAVFACADPDALDVIDVSYFRNFPNALVLEIQAVSDKGGFGARVVRDRPVLVLDGKL